MLDRITAFVMIVVAVLGSVALGMLAATMVDSPPFGLAVAIATLTAISMISAMGGK